MGGLMKVASGLRTKMTVVFMKVSVELAFICKIDEAHRNLINYKMVLREPSFMNKTLMSFTEGCYLVYKKKFM